MARRRRGLEGPSAQLRLLALLAGLARGRAGSGECFPEDYHLEYYDCCREMQRDGRTILAAQCFNFDEFTFERCCDFEFGPHVRGLPYTCAREPDAIADLDIGSAGRLRISCLPPGVGLQADSHGAALANASSNSDLQTIWMTSWFVARFLVDLDSIVERSSGTWEAPLELLRPLLRRPLRVLDVGCGTGILSVALAKKGHEVVAADIDARALATTRANFLRNKVRGSTVQWDMLTAPDSPLLKQRFDVVFAEVSSVAMLPFLQGVPQEELFDHMGIYYQEALNRLILLDAQVFVFVGVYFRKHPSRLEVITSALLYCLESLGRVDSVARPCGPGNAELCPRVPHMSPKHWLSQMGLGPPTAHGIIVW